MTRETIALILQALQPVLLALITAAAAWAAAQVRRRTQDARITAAVDTLARGAEGVVADLSQHVVSALKDPSQPGTWDQVAAQSARATAIRRLRALFPQDVAALEAGGIGRVDELLGVLVERGVIAAKGGAVPAVPTATPSTVTPSKVPPPSGEAGFARPGAVALLLAVALCLAGLGAVLSGCPQVREGVMRITPGVPEPTVCVPDTQRCAGAVPEVCSRNETGTTRWWPSLAPRLDGTPRVCAGGCSVSDAGLAGCDPVLPDNPFTADGGAR